LCPALSPNVTHANPLVSGKAGQLVRIDEDGDGVVRFSDGNWYCYNPQALTLLDGKNKQAMMFILKSTSPYGRTRPVGLGRFILLQPQALPLLVRTTKR
jgi:hypothetical protein